MSEEKFKQISESYAQFVEDLFSLIYTYHTNLKPQFVISALARICAVIGNDCSAPRESLERILKEEIDEIYNKKRIKRSTNTGEE
jgi:hypothetical protein